MRATLRSVVRPLLSREAHSSATPAFLEVLTSIEPDSVVGHLTLLLDEIVDDETRPLLARGRQQQGAYLEAALRDAHDRGQLQRQPPADAADLWLDLLTGVAVASAIEPTGQAASRALALIDHDMDRWTQQ